MEKEKNSKNNNKKELLSIKEVAELFGVHQQTLRRWDEQGKLKSVRVGELGHRKYRAEEIKKILSDRK